MEYVYSITFSCRGGKGNPGDHTLRVLAAEFSDAQMKLEREKEKRFGKEAVLDIVEVRRVTEVDV